MTGNTKFMFKWYLKPSSLCKGNRVYLTACSDPRRVDGQHTNGPSTQEERNQLTEAQARYAHYMCSEVCPSILRSDRGVNTTHMDLKRREFIRLAKSRRLL